MREDIEEMRVSLTQLSDFKQWFFINNYAIVNFFFNLAELVLRAIYPVDKLISYFTLYIVSCNPGELYRMNLTLRSYFFHVNSS